MFNWKERRSYFALRMIVAIATTILSQTDARASVGNNQPPISANGAATALSRTYLPPERLSLSGHCCTKPTTLYVGQATSAIQAQLGKPYLVFRINRTADAYLYILSKNVLTAYQQNAINGNQFLNNLVTLRLVVNHGRIALIALEGGNEAVTQNFEFDGISLGSPISLARTKLGGPGGWNNSHDFLEYFPKPYSFNVNTTRQTIQAVDLGDSLTLPMPGLRYAFGKKDGHNILRIKMYDFKIPN